MVVPWAATAVAAPVGQPKPPATSPVARYLVSTGPVTVTAGAEVGT